MSTWFVFCQCRNTFEITIQENVSTGLLHAERELNGFVLLRCRQSGQKEFDVRRLFGTFFD
ncbi:hypothetical protein H9Y05_04520 [Crocinitomicaceae bacterium CZZ-1]|uniref:Uncharacterized protein n=1 Tax=Taishania pollutisoli TaxID=2766479 RepID=A0A8J6PDU4_9FLAO|nr:hypothetical protein [Taishania pollutisoli]MBC9811735.1 hypothetical protein [Taishania pollutisoli]